MINPVDSTLQGLNNRDLMVMDGIAEGNEKDLSGCRKDVLFMLNSTIKKIVCRNDPVILFEIVTVSPGLILWKNMSPSPEPLRLSSKNNEFY